jgi:hypothetical protein
VLASPPPRQLHGGRYRSKVESSDVTSGTTRSLRRGAPTEPSQSSESVAAVGGETPQHGTGSPRARARVLVTAAAIAAGVVGLFWLLYATSVHAAAGTSDKATTILVGQAMADGHLLLHGWILPPGNYWTSDAAFYAIAVRLEGLKPGLLYSEPAVLAVLTIVIGVVIAREGRRGAPAIAGGVSVVVLLALATPTMAYWFVAKDFHVGSGLYVLLAFWALRRGRFGFRWALAVVLVTVAMLGDLEVLAFAVAPLILAGLAAMLRERRWQSGAAQVSAAVAAVAGAEVLLRIRDALGGFKPSAALPLASVAEMVTNLKHLATFGAYFVGISNGRFETGGVPLWLLRVHAVGGICIVACLIAALASLVVALFRSGRRDEPERGDAQLWRLDDMLLFGTLGAAAPFVILAQANGLGVHFLTVMVVFASILTGRMVARAWSNLPTGRVTPALAILGVAVSLSFAAGLGYELARADPVQPQQYLATWLEAHGLRNGVGGYWTAAITTVESRGAVTVAPAEAAKGGKILRYMSQSTSTWYAGQRFQFYVFHVPRHHSNGIIAAATRTWGKPAHIYTVGVYRVLVWGRPIRVAPFPRGADSSAVRDFGSATSKNG